MSSRFRSPQTKRKLFALLLCYSLLLTYVAPFAMARAKRFSAATGRAQQEAVAVTGAPEGIFPNLDEVKNLQLPQPIAPPSVPSTMRSLRNPLVPRTVLHVGDPLPSPLPSPSLLPSPSPSPLPSPSISPLPLVWLGRPAARTPWTKSDNGEELLPYLLAWNHNYPTLSQSGYSAFQLYGLTGSILNSPTALWLPNASVSDNAAFDFFMVPLPQAGSTRIVFTSNRDGNAQIYSMNQDGSGLTRLTNNSYNDDQPRWSPNGTKILFQSDRDSTQPNPENPEPSKNDIYVMNADGTGQTRLTTNAADDCNAAWSPDGTKIVFQSLRNGSYYQVYTMNADGTNQINLSYGVAADYQPSWSPNGLKMAFASERDHAGAPSIYVMNANGSSQTRLTFSSEVVRDEQPAWSRDAARIAFVSTRDGNKEVYVMNADGSSPVRLTSNLESDDSPYWSPDGTQIVFRSERERDSYDPIQQLWMMNADGNNQTLLAGNSFGDYSPSWHAPGNQSPVASSGGPYSGLVAQNVPFNGGGSFDPDGTISTYSWSFGDGGTGSGVSLTHTYASAGTYNVTLTVTDNLGAQTSATTTTSITTAASEQYLANFNLSALARQPYTNESSYWNDILRAAYPNGQSSMLLAVRELGKTLFESSDYAARARDNHLYVYDLYKTYLMRDPDAPGWAFWENECNLYGRAQVRRAFDECGEFAGIVATLTPSGSPSSNVSSLASARIDPFNQPGNGLTARDAEWSVPLLSLRGRAGLDLGLSLSYSSMIWTHSGPYIYFDEDNGWPSPGFRLGFPTIQERVFDAQAGRNVYVLLTGGSRVSLRQLGTSNVYEAADSGYLQLIDYGGTLLVRTTDGTQLSYQSFNDEWRCTQIKDRNGNYITVNYDWLGHITTIVDTLARTITFNYDTNANLLSITQSWTVNGVSSTHTWASFGWDTKTLQTSFSGVLVVGAQNGTTIPILSQIGFDDGTYCKFLYSSAGQVTRITHYASDSNPLSDNHPRNYTAYDYQSTSDDCPRVSASRVWAENWTGINGVPVEVVTQYGDPGDGSHTTTSPDGTLYKEFYGTGWQRGLTTQTEVWSAGVKQKWTVNNWTQDNTGVNYQTNPRVTETNVFDAGGNRRRTTVSYAPSFTLPSGAICSLPRDTREYASDATTILRRTHVDYRLDPNLDASYLDRHIIGLVKEQTLYEVNGGAETLMSKVGFGYDETGSIQGIDAPVRHDNDNYSATFVTGRANLSSVKRYDVTDTSQFTVSSMKYNAAGSAVSITDPLPLHTTTVIYVDSFSDGNNGRNTLAYPKTVTDADGYSSTLIYNFDFGGVTSKQTPQPNTTQSLAGPVQTLTYDAAGRIERITATTNGAYMHYVYGPNYLLTLSTVNNVADEAYSSRVLDGLGRTVVAATNHPGVIEGRYSAVNTIYDLMGRAVKQSNPTETNGAWAPGGDDAGWLYTQQTYDWKGRPLVTTNTDLTTKEANYSGCGCAGGEVATLTDEVGRRQKLYSDVLGRTWKTETLNWDSSVYSTTTSTFNARDQVTVIRQFQGSEAPEGSGTYQDTAMSYDGYGRLQTKHVPEQDSGTATIYAYNPDDTIHSVTDARGASATYDYNNNRHLVNTITYSAPAGITPTSNVSFGYDAVGNRTLMTDGLGSKTYNYNQLSQVTSETRTFSIGGYTLSYDYNLAGELKKATDATNMTIKYGYDNAGRLNAVTGSDNLYAGVSNYASNFQYRAWSGLKAMTDGNNHTSSLVYNSKLQPTHFELSGNTVSQNYDYYNDGRISFVHNTTDANFDRSYSYDHLGRLIEAKSGGQARGDFGDTPYYESFGYDPFSNLTARQSDSWNGQTSASDSASYLNNRQTGWSYDADGRNTAIGTRSNTFDASGRQTQMTAQQVLLNGNHVTVNQTDGYDGDGARVYEVASGVTTYYLRSTALGGQIIEELNNSGQKTVGYVSLPGGQLLAKQTSNPDQIVTWKHNTPAGTGEYTINNTAIGRTEFDPLGADISLTQPAEPPPPENEGDIGAGHFGGIMDQRWTDFFNLDSGFTVNGFSISSNEAAFYLNFGTGRSSIENIGVSSKDVANALGAVFAPAGAGFARVIVSGVEGTPGHQTIEWQWITGVRDASGNILPSVFGPVATAYSGSTFIPGSIVTLGSSVQLQQPQNSNDLKISNAFGDASSALAARQRRYRSCIDFFTQGRSLEEISKIFQNFWKTAESFPSSAKAVAGTLNSGDGMGARLNLYAPFFADDGTTEAGKLAGYHWSPGRGRYEELFTSLTPRQYRALTILHEFAHALGLIPSDKNSKDQSQKNDDKIFEKCGAILDKLPE